MLTLPSQQHSRAPRILSLAIFLTYVVIYTIVFNIYEFALPELQTILLILSSINIFLLIGLSGVYFWANNFYRDKFYLLISFGWITSAFTSFFQVFTSVSASNVWYFVLSSWLNIFPALFLYMATLTPAKEPINNKKLLRGVIRWVLLALLITLILNWAGQSIHSISSRAKFIMYSSAGVPFTLWALYQVGKCSGTRLDRDIHGDWAHILPYSFYAYSFLQPLYVFSALYPIALLGFFASMLIKTINLIAIAGVIQRDSFVLQNNLYERMNQRSVLEEIGMLASGVEHDIRTPLGMINIEIDQMKSRFRNQHELVARLNEIEKQAHRIYSATEIIPVLRGGRDFYESLTVKANVDELLLRSLKTLKKEINTSNIFFKVDSRPYYVKVNPSMIEQALINILKNAVEAIRSANRQKGLIQIRVKPTPDQSIRIDITDNGCGFPEEHTSKLGALFTTKKAARGNRGVGLFIANKTIDVHGGRLEIQSSSEGATVSVTIPRWDSK